MSQAAFIKKIKIRDPADSAGGFDDVEATDGALNHGGVILDDTEMASNAGFRSRIYGLRDWSVTFTAEYSPTRQSLVDLRAAWLNRTKVDVQYLPDGTIGNGFQGKALVESFNLSGDIEGKETVSVTLQGDDALGAAV